MHIYAHILAKYTLSQYDETCNKVETTRSATFHITARRGWIDCNVWWPRLTGAMISSGSGLPGKFQRRGWLERVFSGICKNHPKRRQPGGMALFLLVLHFGQAFFKQSSALSTDQSLLSSRRSRVV